MLEYIVGLNTELMTEYQKGKIIKTILLSGMITDEEYYEANEIAKYEENKSLLDVLEDLDYMSHNEIIGLFLRKFKRKPANL